LDAIVLLDLRHSHYQLILVMQGSRLGDGTQFFQTAACKYFCLACFDYNWVKLVLFNLFVFKAWSLIKLAAEKKNEEDKQQTKEQAYQDDQQSDQPASPKKQRITRNSNGLLPNRFIPGNHFPGVQKRREACVWCHWKAKDGKIIINKKNPPQSIIFC